MSTYLFVEVPTSICCEKPKVLYPTYCTYMGRGARARLPPPPFSPFDYWNAQPYPPPCSCDSDEEEEPEIVRKPSKLFPPAKAKEKVEEKDKRGSSTKAGVKRGKGKGKGKGDGRDGKGGRGSNSKGLFGKNKLGGGGYGEPPPHLKEIRRESSSTPCERVLCFPMYPNCAPCCIPNPCQK